MSFRGTDRRAFSRKVQRIAIARAKGHCQGCTAPLAPGRYRVDHIVPWELSRDSSINNAQVLCSSCDHGKTYRVDIPVIAKSDRQRDKHIGSFACPLLGTPLSASA